MELLHRAPTLDSKRHPASENPRLDLLRSFPLLDARREAPFDRIVYTAAQIFRTPIALISFADAATQWFKASVGLAQADLHKTIAFCNQALMSDPVFTIEDAALDARFVDNPLVAAKPFIRFYAGVALTGAGGSRIGVLSVLDTRPRILTPYHAQQLRLLGRGVVESLAGRET